MKDNYEVLVDLRKEVSNLQSKINNLTNLKYGNSMEYIKLGEKMCSLLDIQENIMKSYREVLIARIILLESKEYENN